MGNALTEEIRRAAGDDTINPHAVGMVLRAIRTGIEKTALGIARDPEIEYEEAGRLMRSLALVHDSIDNAFKSTTPRPASKMPSLNRT